MPAVVLAADSITKSFAGVQALKGVSFDVRAHEIHALVGENGAGKSTLIKIMTGAEVPDGGTLTVAGRVVSHLDPSRAHAAGIAAVYQQPALFPHLSVAENLALSLEEATPWRRVNWPARRERARALLARIGAAIDPDRRVETLSMPEQQLVEIARALGSDARVLVLDEPTASLTTREVDALLDVVRRLRTEGVGIVYISHRLDEVLAIADRVTVLRDGRTVDTDDARGLTSGDLVRRMVGEALEEPAIREARTTTEPALEVRDLSSAAAGIANISFAVGRGEILGLAGLAGAGRTELAEAIFGIRPVDSGTVLIDGAAQSIGTAADAVDAGVGYVPEDRRRHGVMLDMTIAANCSLASLDRVSAHGLIDRTAERNSARQAIDALQIKAPDPDAEVGTLSGGNQQKVAVARWLATRPRVLILDEPTQGVDVRAKGEIHRLIQGFADDGLAILLISSDLSELLLLSDRVAVMRGGRIVDIIPRESASRHTVLALALGADARKGDREDA